MDPSGGQSLLPWRIGWRNEDLASADGDARHNAGGEKINDLSTHKELVIQEKSSFAHNAQRATNGWVKRCLTRSRGVHMLAEGVHL